MNAAQLQSESEVLRSRMARLRRRMDRDFDDAVDSTKRLLSWKYYLDYFPLASVGAVAATAFLLAPGHKRYPTVKVEKKSLQEALEGNERLREVRKEEEPSASPALLATVGMAIGSAALRYAMQYAAGYANQQLSSYFNQHLGRKSSDREGVL